MWPSNVIFLTHFLITSALAARKVLRAAGPALSFNSSPIKLTTVLFLFDGTERLCRRAAVSDALSGLSFAVRVGMIDNFSSPSSTSATALSHSRNATATVSSSDQSPIHRASRSAFSFALAPSSPDLLARSAIHSGRGGIPGASLPNAKEPR